jgi:hypothetical protein
MLTICKAGTTPASGKRLTAVKMIMISAAKAKSAARCLLTFVLHGCFVSRLVVLSAFVTGVAIQSATS